MVDVGDWWRKLGAAIGTRVSSAIALAGLGWCATALPAHSAETIIVSYGALERSILVEDLEAFAQGQDLSPQLAAYARYAELTDSDLAALRDILTERAELSHVDLSQFLYTSQGKTLLELLGNIIQTPARQSGFSAIRAGVILAAADDKEGLSILNFLKKYPTPGIRIDLAQGLSVAESVFVTLDHAERAFTLVHALAAESAQQTSPEEVLATQQLLFELPRFDVTQELMRLPARQVEATLFLPQPRLSGQPLPEEIPVVVISHGLGDGRTSYDYLANFLAERGFAVASLDHPGSNSQQIAQLLSGLSPELIDDHEFANRPIDVSELLNELEQFAKTRPDLGDRLNTNNVGVIGHSFGGYTALALGGATYSPETLLQACEPQPDYLNPSLLLQCQASGVMEEAQGFKDDRVRAVLAVNPVGRDIFGPSGYRNIGVPTMIFSATDDTVAPALPEQIEPFTWLQTPSRYLVLASDTTHFSVIDWDPTNEPLIAVPEGLLGTSPELAKDYLQTLALVFMLRYLQQDSRYDAALTAQFIDSSVMRSPLTPLSLIDNLRAEALDQAINGDDLLTDLRPAQQSPKPIRSLGQRR
ncbi:alpha/beta hydrolase [Leptolyngbya iicbica]|uniref:Alpha/beta fold hydrolase n=2 Tax=Cyanophyceae TaxID=3028117 RepID=A0A4Q7EAG6_9CYAN|nr:alpha/beta hydrolase [Leptolyngbya sp. LK]RZM77985.1 alpha/beta fold hydrolase [Leptolyngbya sp. LK]